MLVFSKRDNSSQSGRYLQCYQGSCKHLAPVANFSKLKHKSSREAVGLSIWATVEPSPNVDMKGSF